MHAASVLLKSLSQQACDTWCILLLLAPSKGSYWVLPPLRVPISMTRLATPMKWLMHAYALSTRSHQL